MTSNALLEDFARFVNDAESGAQFAKWAHDNPNDLAKWRAFRDAIVAGQRPNWPTMATPHGRELVDAGRQYLDATEPVQPPPPPSGMLIGFNAYPGQNAKAQEFSKNIRIDRGQPSDWSGATACGIIGLDSTSWMTACEYIELDNETYFNGWNGLGGPAQWAVKARDCAKAIGAKNPAAKILLPLIVQVNGGDVFSLAPGATHTAEALEAERTYHAAFHAERHNLAASLGVEPAAHRMTQSQHDDLHEKALAASSLGSFGATWQSFVSVIETAAPDIWKYVYGYGVHPYCQGQPPAQAASMQNMTKVRGQIDAIPDAKGKPYYATEFGYTTGPSQDGQPPVTEAQQATFLGQQLAAFKARGDIAGAYIFVLYDQPGVWAYGLLRSDGSRKPAWDAAHAAV